MKTLLEKSASGRFGPDPVLLKKRGLSDSNPRNISDYKERIKDKDYMEHAIDRIAMELMHFLAK
ncbi:MAG: hypothetical protein H7A21_20280 [Spirochaetales bacterium]|nr:hypothetical protein [Leptospiraceae bacterium]MCP5483788.1 hypothetical protein [Spirochaetales bacterium]